MFLSKIDRWLLLHSPGLWLTRIHVITAFTLGVLPVFAVLALILPRIEGDVPGQMPIRLFVPCFLSLMATPLWLSRQIQIGNRLTFTHTVKAFPYTLLFLWCVLCWNIGPVLFIALYMRRNNLAIIFGDVDVLWYVAMLVLIASVLSAVAAVGVCRLYPRSMAIIIMLTIQGGLYAVISAEKFIGELIALSPFLICFYLGCAFIAQFSQLGRTIIRAATACAVVATPLVPLLCLGILKLVIRQSTPSGTALFGILLGACLSVLLAPLWERKLAQVSACPD